MLVVFAPCSGIQEAPTTSTHKIILIIKKELLNLLINLTSWADMPTIWRCQPAIIDSVLLRTFNPRPAITNTPPGSLTLSWCAAKFDRTHALGITNITKDYFSYTHNAML
jgi:hypothetical protein